jgi:hypothetical protein
MEYSPESAALWYPDLLHVSTCGARDQFKFKEQNGITVETSKRPVPFDRESGELRRSQFPPVGLVCFSHIVTTAC